MGGLWAKLPQSIDWMRSVRHVVDWPAASLLWLYRHRPPSGLAGRSLERLIPRVLIRPRLFFGFSLAIDPTNLSQLIIYEEIFIQGNYDLSSLPFEPDVVVDCGAFQGYFTLLARAHFETSTLVVFEPEPTNYAAMCSNFKRNAINVEAHPKAVSNRSGKMFFSGGGLGGRLCYDTDEPSSRQVQVISLADVISELSPSRLLLKLDVEGEEDRILPDLVPILPPTCAVFFESHSGNDGFSKLEGFLRKANFAVERRRTHGVLFVDAFAFRVQEKCSA